MSLDASGPNAEQIKYWNDNAGPKWVEQQQALDGQIRPLGLRAMDAARIAPGDHVLDVGCGCGETSLEIARRVGARGSVTGIDISTPMLDRARTDARKTGIGNTRFENLDAQTAALPRARYDVLFSRFGVMFFIDPTAAFTNLRSALKPGARLGFVCWRALPENPWMMVPMMAAAQHITLPAPPPPDAPGPGSFADSGRVTRILDGAGFTDLAFTELNETLVVGGTSTLEQTVDFILNVGPTGNAVREAAASAGARQKVYDAVLEALRPYYQPGGGVRMPSGAWIVTARNP